MANGDTYDIILQDALERHTRQAQEPNDPLILMIGANGQTLKAGLEAVKASVEAQTKLIEALPCRIAEELKDLMWPSGWRGKAKSAGLPAAGGLGLGAFLLMLAEKLLK